MSVLLRGGKLFLSNGDFSRGDLLIENGRLAGVKETPRSADAQKVDLDGRWVLPGFIDAHLHLATPRSTDVAVVLESAHNARLELACGVTTVRDMGGYHFTVIALKRAIDQGWIPGPQIVACGQAISMTGGHTYDQAMEADGPEEIRKAVRVQLRAGANWIYVIGSAGVDEDPETPQLTFEEIRAAVVEAKRHHVPVSVHAHPPETIKDALRAGVDTIEHGTYPDEEAIELLLKTRAFLVPTIAVYENIAQSAADPELRERARRVFEHKMETFKDVVERGVRWGVAPDLSVGLRVNRLVSELRLLQKAGLESQEILLQATKGNAELLGMSDKIGTLEVGKLADIVVLEGDPIQDLSSAGNVHLTIKGGQLYSPTNHDMGGRA